MCNFKEKVKKLDLWDISLIKFSSMAFILIVFKGIRIIWDWDLFTHVSIWWFVALFIVLAIKPAMVYFKKEKKETETPPPPETPPSETPPPAV